MAIESKLVEIGITAISLAIGFLSFYLLNEHSKETKRRHLEEFTSQLINLVLFIWLGKIVLNLRLFISDPLAILAYPSNSDAFYFAIGCVSLLLLFKAKRKKMYVLLFLESFVQVILVGSFIYEFIQLIVNDNRYALGYLLLLAILMGIFIFFRERMTSIVLLMTVITAWSLGMVILMSIQPFVTVFGYIIGPGFVGLFFAMSISRLAYQLRRRDT